MNKGSRIPLAQYAPMYVINLESELERRRNILKQFQELNIEPRFVRAVDGHETDFPYQRYKDVAAPFWGRADTFKPGAFGCYLSHAKCWETIAESDCAFAIILEDDVEINVPRFEEFCASDLLGELEFDVIFVNHGGNRWVGLTNVPDENASYIRTSNAWAESSPVRKNYVSVSSLLVKLVLEGRFAYKVQATGSYGYVVSRKGAKKLLEMMRTRKICMGVDYAMIFNSLDEEDVRTLENASPELVPENLRFFLEREQECCNIAGPIGLKSYMYAPVALVRHKDFPSTIQHSKLESIGVFYR